MSGMETETDNTWLSDDDLESIRAQMPVVYVEAVPLLAAAR